MVIQEILDSEEEKRAQLTLQQSHQGKWLSSEYQDNQMIGTHSGRHFMGCLVDQES